MTSTMTLPAVPSSPIETADALVALCERLRAARRFAFDTEFIGENTYQPILCLIQVATEERVDLIDPLAIDRDAMLPFWQLLADPGIEKICHAGDQDVEIAWQHSGLVTKNMFDTQIGAGMVGLSYPTALWRVVEHFSGVTLEKAHTYSAWDRRPLSKSQFAYAVDDVRYLPLIHTAMKARIAELNHTQWMIGACDEMCGESATPSDARKMFAKIRGGAGLDSVQLSVLREVTAAREQLAFEHDRPSRAILKDDALIDIAVRMPADIAGLRSIRDVPRDLIDMDGDAILDAVACGIGTPDADRPTLLTAPEDSADVKRLSEILWVAAQVICLGQSVTPALVTSQNEVLSLARLVYKKKPLDQHPLLRNWHRECLGEKLVAFLQGTLTIQTRMSHEEMQATFSGGKSEVSSQ